MKKILSLLTTLLLLASCSQEELGTPFYAGQEVSISAAFSNSHPANNGKQRISGKDSGNHTATNTTIQPFYRLVGTASVASATSSSLMIDFY